MSNAVARDEEASRAARSTARNFGGPAPSLPKGHTPSEKRGRLFFEDRPPEPPNFKLGLCSACHSGPMLDQTNQFLPVAVPPGTRFQTVLVSEFNAAGNPLINFTFRNQEHDLGVSNQDGTPDGIIEVTSPDPGRALIWPTPPLVDLTDQDKKDIVAFMKLLN